MKVSEMITELSKFSPDAEVLITDGFKGVFYRGNFEITEYEGCADIGIGGCDEEA